MNEMKTRYRLIFRGVRGGMFYCVDKVTGKRTSLQTTDKDEAQQIMSEEPIKRLHASRGDGLPNYKWYCASRS